MRIHKAPRLALFCPKGIPNGPGRKSRLAITRETVGISELGERFALSDDWTKAAAGSGLTQRWTGATIFKVVPVGDNDFGGDQRRQRDRRGHPKSKPERPQVSWADLSDGG